MGVTYTRAGDLQRVRNRSTSITFGERLLLLTSAAVVLAILLAYAGRIRAEQFGEPHAPLPINLNTQTKTDALEVPLATVFTYPADRRFAARVVAAHLQPAGAPRLSLIHI